MLTKYIKELVDLVGVSSREEEVIRYIFPKFKEYSEDVHVDKLGNIILKIPSKKENVKKLKEFLLSSQGQYIIEKTGYCGLN